VSEPLDFGRQIVNRTGRYNGLGRRDPDDEHRIVERYRAPVEMRLAERHRLERADEDQEEETEATGDVVLDEYLRRHRSGF
jgi:hypothetical protein